MSIPTIPTERLTLRPLAISDAPALFSLFNSQAALRYWHHPIHQRQEETSAMIAQMIGASGACWWAITLKQQEQAVGLVGFLGATPVPGMGYILHPGLWGQGYASEAVRAAIEHGFTQLGYERIELWIHQDNSASQRLAQRNGFLRQGFLHMRWWHFAQPHEMAVYGLRAQDWLPDASPARPALSQRIEPILPVADVSKAVAYYRDTLGFQIGMLYGDPPSHASVFRGEWSSQPQIQLTKSAEPFSPSWVYLFVGPGIDQLYADYLTRGVNCIEPLSTKPWGMREFIITDNDGHKLRFGSAQ